MSQPHYEPTIQPWKEVSRGTVFEKFGRGIERVVFQLPNGSETEYYIKKEKSTVAVFAVTNTNDVILIEEFRPGPEKIIRELPGGFIDKKETPLQAVKRELFEESEYTGSWQYLFSFHDCAYSTRIRHCFIATNCKIKSRPESTRQYKEGRVVLMPLADFRKIMFQNPMTDIACALAALAVLFPYNRGQDKKR